LDRSGANPSDTSKTKQNELIEFCAKEILEEIHAQVYSAKYYSWFWCFCKAILGFGHSNESTAIWIVSAICYDSGLISAILVSNWFSIPIGLRVCPDRRSDSIENSVGSS